jgi:ligand-binding sensor domain-containing protein
MSARRLLGPLCGLVLGLPVAHPAAAVDPAVPLSQLTRSQWRTEEGLPQDSVNVALQTRDGFLWLATRAGLARFDGVFFALFDRLNTPLLRNNSIQALAEDPADGSLWIGTEGGDLLRYRDGSFRRFGRDDGLIASRIISLEVGQPGELWIGTYGQGLIRFAAGQFTPVAALPHGIVSRIEKDPDGSLWIACYGGGAFHLKDGRLETIGAGQGLLDLRTWWAEPIPGGAAIATDHGLCLFRDGSCTNLDVGDGLSHRQLTSLHADRHGVLWIGTYGGGLNRLHPDGRIEHYRRDQQGADDIVWSIFEDRAGMLWIGTINNGLRLLSDGPFTTLTENDGLSSRRITVIERDQAGRLFLGTRDAGLNLLDVSGEVNQIGREQGLDADTVWSLAAAGDRLYIGTENGLFVRRGDGRVERAELPGFASPPAVSSLLVTADAVYIGSTAGLLRKGNAGSPRLFTVDDGLPSNSVRDLLLDSRGRLWIATLQGVAELANDEIRGLTERDGLPGGNVVALHEDRADRLIYLAIASGGLAALHDNGQIDSWTKKEGLREDDLTAIGGGDDGHLWLGSGRGILRVSAASLAARLRDPQATLAQSFYDRLDGVGDGGVFASGHSVAKGPDGRLYFATLNGLTIYDPKRLRPPATPKAQVTRLEVDGHEVELGGSVSVRPGIREIRLELAAPLPHASGKVALRYQLQGVDPGWIDAGRQRELTLAAPAPGSYDFLVEASNVQGKFLDQPTVLHLQVQPSFYQSWRFSALLLLVPLLLAVAYSRVRAYRHRQRRQELDRRIAEATAAIDMLSGMLPICSSCHKVRDDGGYWEQVEEYLSSHSEAQFTHGLCPDCSVKVLAELDDSKQGLLAS